MHKKDSWPLSEEHCKNSWRAGLVGGSDVFLTCSTGCRLRGHCGHGAGSKKSFNPVFKKRAVKAEQWWLKQLLWWDIWSDPARVRRTRPSAIMGGPVPNPMTFNLQERQKKCLICLFVQGKVVYCSLWIFIFYSTYLKTVCLMGKDFWGEINWAYIHVCIQNPVLKYGLNYSVSLDTYFPIKTACLLSLPLQSWDKYVKADI